MIKILQNVFFSTLHFLNHKISNFSFCRFELATPFTYTTKAMFKFWSIFHIQNLWYSFTRDNSFLQTPSQSLTGKQKNPSLSTSGHSNNITTYMSIFSSILNCSYFFCHQKSNKKANKFGMKFFSTSNIVHGLKPKKWVFAWRVDKT